MAKKTARKTSTGAARGTMSKAAAQVFAETAFATAQGVERGMGSRAYAFANAARDYWLAIHTKSIPRALKRPNANWPNDRQLVLLMAEALGRRAAAHALAAAAPAPAIVAINKAHVVKASKEIRKDPRCRRAVAGSGGYCDEE